MSSSPSAACLFREHCPALIERIVLLLRRFQLRQCLCQCVRVGRNCRIVDEFARSVEAGIRNFDAGFDGIELALLDVGKLLF